MPNVPFSKILLSWFDQHGRKDLPWQRSGNPYHVWLSEIMLQQTQVVTVIPYFERFIAKFPDIDSLANAHIDAVLTLWAGLGYYARGRNLHHAAIAMQQSQGSNVPDDFKALMALPGIGRSTAGAILALAYGKPYPILDGNVRRVLARYDAIPAWPGEKTTELLLWQRAEQLLPEKRLKDYTQAQMDLGATVCKRSKPLCGICPLQSTCKAFQSESVTQYPVAKPKKVSPLRQSFWLVSLHKGAVLLEQRPDKGIWGGLWSFPAFENAQQLKQHLASHDGLVSLPQIRHIFTHFKLDITPILTQQKIPNAHSKQRWVKLEHVFKLALPAPVEKFITSQLVKRFL